jgi:hypothetical protein
MPQIEAVLRAIASAPQPLTSRHLAEAVGINYVRNFNKREHRYAKKLAGFIDRVKGPGPKGARQILYRALSDAWKGHDVEAIVQAFNAPRVVALVRQPATKTPEASDDDLGRSIESDHYQRPSLSS